jgi:hypothetical protein
MRLEPICSEKVPKIYINKTQNLRHRKLILHIPNTLLDHLYAYASITGDLPAYYMGYASHAEEDFMALDAQMHRTQEQSVENIDDLDAYYALDMECRAVGYAAVDGLG